MLKSEIIEKLQLKHKNLSTYDIELILKIFFKKIISSLKTGNAIELRGFGTIKKNTYEVVATYIASGIEPKKSIIFNQSNVLSVCVSMDSFCRFYFMTSDIKVSTIKVRDGLITRSKTSQKSLFVILLLSITSSLNLCFRLTAKKNSIFF